MLLPKTSSARLSTKPSMLFNNLSESYVGVDVDVCVSVFVSNYYYEAELLFIKD